MIQPRHCRRVLKDGCLPKLLSPSNCKPLCIPLADRKEDLQSKVLTLFQGKAALLCLDNFEAIWDVETQDPVAPKLVETFLSHFSNISMLSILITMHGSQIPHGVPWSKPYCIHSSPLNLESSIQIFEKISPPVDVFVTKLLQA